MSNDLLNPDRTVYENIKHRCKELGISVSDLCRVADVERVRLQYWSQGNPKTLQTLLDLDQAFDKIVEWKKEE